MAKSEVKRRAPNRYIISHLIAVAIGVLLGRTSTSYDTTALLMTAAIREKYQETSATVTEHATTIPAASFYQSSKVKPVNCSKIPEIQPVNIAGMTSPAEKSYLVSYSWWDSRLTRPAYIRQKRKAKLKANPAVSSIQKLLLETPPTTAFIDVGANVGFMTNFATRDRMVFAIDPLSYDIAKLCEGNRANLEEGWAKPGALQLYHAAAGPASQPNITIMRPADDVGYFDQASLSAEAIKKARVVEEVIPMITVDSIVPDDVAVGVVKIDVQGHEYGVLQGMTTILKRTTGYPLHIFYENSQILTAGAKHKTCAEFLQSFGYGCNVTGNDVFCSKA